MGVGVYGITRPADVSIQDIDIYYNYTPNRETFTDSIYKLNAQELMTYNYLPSEDQDPSGENLLEGLYNLKLPASVFNQLGIYTIYIRPKSITTKIRDCGILYSMPNVRGIVIDGNLVPEGLRSNNALQGYRIEYIDPVTKSKVRNTVRYIVSSNRVVPITDNVGDVNQKSIKYKFDDSGSLLFLQVTPSSASNIKPNSLPSIGIPDQTIIISNTFFSPMAIEVEMVANTIDTLSDLVGGEQIRDVDNGILTYFDSNRNIIKQFDIYEVKSDVGDVSLYEVKEKRTVIDKSQNFDNVTSGL